MISGEKTIDIRECRGDAKFKDRELCDRRAFEFEGSAIVQDALSCGSRAMGARSRLRIAGDVYDKMHNFQGCCLCCFWMRFVMDFGYILGQFWHDFWFHFNGFAELPE